MCWLSRNENVMAQLTWTCGCPAETGPQDADRADILLMVEQYRERLTGSTETPANDGTGRGPSGAAGSTSGTLMACTKQGIVRAWAS